MSRGRKLIALCNLQLEKGNTTHHGPSITKNKKNWFCNRSLLPTSENSSSEKKSMNTKSMERIFNDNGKVAEALTEDAGKKIIVHDVAIVRGPGPFDHKLPSDSSELEAVSSEEKEEKNICAKEEVCNTLNNVSSEDTFDAPVTPEDPFGTLESEGSLYCPSSDEDTDSSGFDHEDDRRNLKPSKERKKTCKKNSIHESSSDVNNKIPRIFMDSDKFQNNDINLDAPNVERSKVPYKRKPDYCYFCETPVLNFGRHIVRNHSIEIDVTEILAKPVNSKERRHLFDILRRKGNFLADNGTCFKPVREGYAPEREKLPCDNCLGYFSSKLLNRHKKRSFKDKLVSGDQNEKRFNVFGNFRIDRRLIEQVFPHMRADRISFEAKKENLICEFGARYMKTQREKHFIHVTSRKMRELSNILLEIRKIDPSITTLLSALRPKYFDIFVEATKRVAKYDIEKDVYNSPTFAINIVTSLKQCCDIAITFIYTKNVEHLSVPAATLEADLKTLVRLFETNWSYEVSSHAANNLKLNKWNKVTIVPLASDLRLLRDHLVKLATESLKILQKSLKDKQGESLDTSITTTSPQSLECTEMSQLFNNLVESVYCRVILLNRRRSGELQRMYLHTYINASSETQKYEEFTHAVSQPEEILLKSLKRVVIRGKRGRGRVPVLFSSDVQEHIKYILEVRDHFVPKDNPYLFAAARSASHLIGYKILMKHAKRSGAKNPSAITSTCLRKHLATLSQLFNLSEGEIEQLATFMGHTAGVHKSSYRLPDDIYQTAKISKLLMIMEDGSADKYKGKSIDEIYLDLDENLLEASTDNDSDNNDDRIIDELIEASNSENMCLAPDYSENRQTNLNLQKKPKRILVPWSDEQKRVTTDFFKDHIKKKRFS
nr:unnamed protein product [Callosobruchus analis]